MKFRRRGLGAAKDGADPRQQFTRRERLGEVVIGPHFQTDHAIDLVALRRQHQDRDVVVRAQPSADRQPVLARQHQIQH